MGRLPRPIEDGFVYHALNRGNNRADILKQASDHEAFLEALGKTQQRYPFRLFGYCLMTNHVHLLLQPERGQSISRIMQSLTVAHTRRYHSRYRSVGHVWQGRFRSPVVQDGDHLLAVVRYIEANPLRARMVTDLTKYRWSSYQSHGLGRPDPLLSRFPEWDELGRGEVDRRAHWRRRVTAPQREGELMSIRESIRTGKPYGAHEWVETNARGLNLPPQPRPVGRPRKAAPDRN
jgi:putative transposase